MGFKGRDQQRQIKVAYCWRSVAGFTAVLVHLCGDSEEVSKSKGRLSKRIPEEENDTGANANSTAELYWCCVLGVECSTVTFSAENERWPDLHLSLQSRETRGDAAESLWEELRLWIAVSTRLFWAVKSLVLHTHTHTGWLSTRPHYQLTHSSALTTHNFLLLKCYKSIKHNGAVYWLNLLQRSSEVWIDAGFKAFYSNSSITGPCTADDTLKINTVMQRGQDFSKKMFI